MHESLPIIAHFQLLQVEEVSDLEEEEDSTLVRDNIRLIWNDDDAMWLYCASALLT